MWQPAYLTLLYFCCQTLIVAIRHLLFATFIIIITMYYCCCYYCCHFCSLSFTSCDRTVTAVAAMRVWVCCLLRAAGCLPFTPHSLTGQQHRIALLAPLASHVTWRDVSSPAVHFSIFCCLTWNPSSDKDACKKLQVSVTHTHMQRSEFFFLLKQIYLYVYVLFPDSFCASYLLDIIICVALSDTPARLSW